MLHVYVCIPIASNIVTNLCDDRMYPRVDANVVKRITFEKEVSM